MPLADRASSLAQSIAADIKTLAGRIKGFAPLDSPTFTTVVNVPTPANDDNSTKAAPTSWVLARIAALVGFSNWYREKVQNLGNVSGAVTLDVAKGSYFKLTAAGAITWTVNVTPEAGYITAFSVEITNGGSGSHSWPSGIKWPGGAAPALSVTGIDVLVFTHDGTTLRGVLAAKDSR